MDDSDGSRSTKESSRSSNSHSSIRNQQIAASANYLAQQQVASNTAANANIRYQEQLPGKSGGHSSSPGQGIQPLCKNCKSTKHTTKSTKCYEPNCGKSFKDAAERKAHYVREHRFYKTDDKQPPAGRKSALKKGQSKPGVKFSKVNRIQSEDGGGEDDDSCIDSEVSSYSSMSVDRPPKSLVWKDRHKSRKVSKIQIVSTIHRTTRLELRLNQTSATPRAQLRRNKRRRIRRSQHRPCDPLYQRGIERRWNGLMDQEHQASGDTEAQNGTTPTSRSMTIRRYYQRSDHIKYSSVIPSSQILRTTLRARANQ
jgi:hypothetical protein